MSFALQAAHGSIEQAHRFRWVNDLAGRLRLSACFVTIEVRVLLQRPKK